MRYWKAKRNSRSNSLKYKLVSFISIAVIGYFIGIMQDFMAEPDQYSIIGKAKVHDGDTLKIGKSRIRIYGLDAPELKQTCLKNGIEIKCGLISKDEMEKIINGREIFCIPLDKDKYQRSDSNCYFKDDTGVKINIGQELVKNGWAMAYQTYSPRYIINELVARTSMKGIWATRFQNPSDWRRQNGIGFKR